MLLVEKVFGVSSYEEGEYMLFLVKRVDAIGMTRIYAEKYPKKIMNIESILTFLIRFFLSHYENDVLSFWVYTHVARVERERKRG